MIKNSIFLILLFFFFSCKSASEIKYEQYLVNGERIYLENCSNCHQKDGSGLNDLYPPLTNSEFLKNEAFLICIIRNGQAGPITVNGKEFNERMPSFPELYDLDLAQLITYMNNEFDKNNKMIEPNKVKELLKKCE